jgi:hypothetical protein
MNLAPIIFATLVISAFAAMPLKPDDALTGLLDEEPATPNKMKPAPKTDIVKTLMKKKKNVPKTSLIDAFLDTKSKAGCVDCTGRARASDEEAPGMSGKEGMSFCYRHDKDDNTTTAADCDGYWGGSVDSPTYGTEYYACELGIKEKTGRYGCVNSAEQCCLDSNGEFSSTAARAGTFTLIGDLTDCPQGDLKSNSNHGTTLTLEQCEEACRQEPDCLVVTMRPSDSRCLLKTDCNSQMPMNDRISYAFTPAAL